MTNRTRAAAFVRGAATGLTSLAVFLAVGEMVALAVGPSATPVVALGENLISHTPQDLKEFAISHFGEHDKTVLLSSVYTALVLIAALAGALSALRWRWAAPAALGVLVLATGASAATAPAGNVWWALPSLGGGVAALISLLWLHASTLAFQAPHNSPGTTAQPGPGTSLADKQSTWAVSQSPSGPLSRRRFLFAGGGILVLAAGAYAAGRGLMAHLYDATASRLAVKLPRPRSSIGAMPGSDLGVPGVGPFITPNHAFYRVDTALVVPQLSTEDYSLNLHGMVARPRVFSYQDLLALPLVERLITMVCVSNPVGGPYIGNARWLGARLADVLEQAGVSPEADQLFMTSTDGMTIGADLKAIMDGRDALLALGMNGEPLPFEHGFPVRAVVPGIYGYASACKWLVDLEVTTYAIKKAYWPRRGYTEKGPIKLESKIDVPTSFQRLKAGTVTVAGTAWHPTVGIRAVQVRVDEQPWVDAVLGANSSVDAWRQWRWEWEAKPGSHSLQVRAIDTRGTVQTAASANVYPSGASGRESIVVTVY